MKLKDRKRQDILDAALVEFGEIGFAAARINRIAELASVSKRTLYNHFESKEALFEAIIDKLIKDGGCLNVGEFDPQSPIEIQLRQSAEAYVPFIENGTYLALARVVTSEFVRDPELSRSMFERDELKKNPFAELIAAAMKAGKLKEADSVYAATQFMASIKAFLYWPQLMIGAEVPPKEQIDKIIADAVTMFMVLYGPEKSTKLNQDEQ